MKREKKYRAKNGSLRNISTNSKRANFVILINHASAPIKKERLSPARKTRIKTSRNKFVKKGGVPDSVESFEEVDSSKNRPRARPGFVKPIQNGLRKKQNLIKSRPSRGKLAWREEKMESREKSIRDSIMR